MNALVHVKNKPSRSDLELLTCRVGEQWIGLHVKQVREVVTGHVRTVMPLAPSSVMGLINLRGRVLTELDVRKVVGLPAREPDASFHVAIIESSSGEDFGLAVDDVGEVMLMDRDYYESTPSSLDPVWRQVSEGVLKQDNRVLVLMNVDRFIALTIPSLEGNVQNPAAVH
ncbi:MAG: chemotaxis protein CheW [Mariprofundaceae bacterium]|nr:chemotaxis protein CheW [Mariprofundaceae bacterium]